MLLIFILQASPPGPHDQTDYSGPGYVSNLHRFILGLFRTPALFGADANTDVLVIASKARLSVCMDEGCLLFNRAEGNEEWKRNTVYWSLSMHLIRRMNHNG